MTQFDQPTPEYKTPEITSMRDEDLLENIGPAQAYTGNFPFGF